MKMMMMMCLVLMWQLAGNDLCCQLETVTDSIAAHPCSFSSVVCKK
jgi:hypothetical protein